MISLAWILIKCHWKCWKEKKNYTKKLKTVSLARRKDLCWNSWDFGNFVENSESQKKILISRCFNDDSQHCMGSIHKLRDSFHLRIEKKPTWAELQLMATSLVRGSWATVLLCLASHLGCHLPVDKNYYLWQWNIQPPKNEYHHLHGMLKVSKCHSTIFSVWLYFTCSYLLNQLKFPLKVEQSTEEETLLNWSHSTHFPVSINQQINGYCGSVIKIYMHVFAHFDGCHRYSGKRGKTMAIQTIFRFTGTALTHANIWTWRCPAVYWGRWWPLYLGFSPRLWSLPVCSLCSIPMSWSVKNKTQPTCVNRIIKEFPRIKIFNHGSYVLQSFHTRFSCRLEKGKVTYTLQHAFNPTIILRANRIIEFDYFPTNPLQDVIFSGEKSLFLELSHQHYSGVMSPAKSLTTLVEAHSWMMSTWWNTSTLYGNGCAFCIELCNIHWRSLSPKRVFILKEFIREGLKFCQPKQCTCSIISKINLNMCNGYVIKVHAVKCLNSEKGLYLLWYEFINLIGNSWV